ncbi:MAG: hypothetical protein NC300_12115 [Bacteroidales bacterium]|nr:hypothetical protein [Clostridium sp.]MCM1204877.1 hypothetical protein [Bacteroidales bacterium]
MTDRNAFMDTIKSVEEILKTSAVPMSEEEILAYFSDMELNEEQKQTVLDYLQNPEEEEEADKEQGVFRLYLDELALLPKYSEEEQLELYKKLLAGDKEMVDAISTAWLERVLTIAKKYAEPELSVEDLVQEGNMALLTELQRLCGSGKEINVEKKLERAVEAGIMSYASDMNREREQENTILGKISLVHEAKKLLTEEKGKSPDWEELSAYTRISVEELKELEDLMTDKRKC